MVVFLLQEKVKGRSLLAKTKKKRTKKHGKSNEPLRRSKDLFTIIIRRKTTLKSKNSIKSKSIGHEMDVYVNYRHRIYNQINDQVVNFKKTSSIYSELPLK